MSTSQKKSRTFWLRLQALAPMSKPRPRENSSFSWMRVKPLNRVSLRGRRQKSARCFDASDWYVTDCITKCYLNCSQWIIIKPFTWWFGPARLSPGQSDLDQSRPQWDEPCRPAGCTFFWTPPKNAKNLEIATHCVAVKLAFSVILVFDSATLLDKDSLSKRQSQSPPLLEMIPEVADKLLECVRPLRQRDDDVDEDAVCVYTLALHLHHRTEGPEESKLGEVPRAVTFKHQVVHSPSVPLRTGPPWDRARGRGAD